MPAGVAEVLPRVGALIEGPAFHPYLTGAQNLRRLDSCDATADPRTSGRRIDAALARVGLTAAAGKKYRNYSLGMKQRLGLAAALLQPRDLLILDEPTNGLDPQGTREVRHLVRDLASDGTTVLVSSHLLSEVEQVASHVGIMAAGALVRQGRLADVLAEGAPRVRVGTPDIEAARITLGRLGLADIAPDVRTGGLTARLGDVPVETVARALVTDGVRLHELGVERPALEDLFVSITGEGFDVLG
jgi:ABC-2 type transport system ATP-binding protein